MDDWVAAASAELGLSPADIRVDTVLDLARDVAHQVLRPGAPVTAYLLGLAVGRGADPAGAAERLTALAMSWPSPDTGAEPSGAEPSGAEPSGAEPSGAEPSEGEPSGAERTEGAQTGDRRGRAEHIDPPIG